MSKIAAASTAFAFAVTIIIFVASGSTAVLNGLLGSTSNLNCTVDAPSTQEAAYETDQLANAAVIVTVGKQKNVPERGQLVAIATAIQESRLRNLDQGDRDSLGLFQQRPSQGWGTPAQIVNPTYAATQFSQHLLATPNWQQMSVSDAAQAVQRSGTPNAYTQHEPAARTMLAAVRGANCTANTSEVVDTDDCNAIQAPTPAAMAAINYACGQRGLPYVWGGNGAQDGGFDCSGLTTAAYAAAGITLPRTAHTQFHAGPHVPAGQPLLPGDLVFYGDPNTKIHHVGLYIGGGLMINAPDFGQVVKIEPYARKDYAGAARPYN